MRARELMSTPVVTVSPETPLKEVAEIMAAHQIETDTVKVATRGGVVTIAGSLETRTDAELVARFAASVDGVVAVDTVGLCYRIDDRHVKVQ